MRGKIIFLLVLGLSFVPVAHADTYAVIDDTMQKQMQISSLKREIQDLENQLAECKRKNKNWKTATWIGAAGTVATGTAAIVQGVKLNKLKQEKGIDSTTKKEDKKQEPKPDDKK